MKTVVIVRGYNADHMSLCSREFVKPSIRSHSLRELGKAVSEVMEFQYVSFVVVLEKEVEDEYVVI